MEAVTEPSLNESDGEDDFSLRKINNNYKNLLDSDSSEDDQQQQNDSTIFSKQPDDEESDNEGEQTIEKSGVRNRIISESDSEPEPTQKVAPMKDRRKNSNPKKKILPEKTQRVRKQQILSKS